MAQKFEFFAIVPSYSRINSELTTDCLLKKIKSVQNYTVRFNDF